MSVYKSIAMFSLAAGASGVVLGAGLTSQSYVQDGLVAQLDAIENAGRGLHEANPSTWRDLVGSAYLTVLNGAVWGERTLDMAKVAHKIYTMPAFDTDNCSTEVAMNLAEGKPAGYQRIFTVDSNQESRYNVYVHPGACTAALYINGKDARPSLGTVAWGTLGISSSTNNCLTYNNPVGYGSGANTGSLGGSAGNVTVPSCNWTIQGYAGSEIHGQYCAFRHYNRPLEQDELAHNALVDKLRFFSFAYRGTGAAVNWADIAWSKPIQAAATAPAVGFADYATVANAAVNVGAGEVVELAGLSLEDGATFAVAEGGVVTVKQLFVEGVKLTRGAYTAAGGNGTTVSWITGAGEVRVTGASATKVPCPVAGLGPLSYVQDGLIAQFDAVDNEGTGVHNASATTWRDLAGSASVTLSGNATWIDRALATGGSQQSIANMPAFYYDSVFTELAGSILSHQGSYARWFYHTGGDAVYNVFHQYSDTTRDEMHFYMGGQSTSRPAFFFSSGTLELGSDRTNLRTYVNGTAGNTSGSFHVNHGMAAAATWYLDKDNNLSSHFRSIRHYNRALTQEEISYNRQIDIQRFESYLFTGDGTAVNWSEIAWLKPELGGTGDAPSGATNEYATVQNASVQATAYDVVALAGLSLEHGATFALGEGSVVSLKLLYVNGVEVPRGVYTADGHGGTTAAAWVTGMGEVRVAGGLGRGVPSIPVADADGWYTYGLMDGTSAQTSGIVTIIGEHPIWDDYLFPAGAKLRLQGYLLLETVPDVFADYDTTRLQRVYVNGTRAYEADRTFEVPAGATMRFLPGTWKSYANNSNVVTSGGVNATLMGKATGNVTFEAGSNFSVMGDGVPNLTFGGNLDGAGTLYLGSYGRQLHLTGGLSLSGSSSVTWQNGSGIWFDTLAITTALQTVTLAACGDSHGMTKTYSASYLMFGLKDSDATADHPLNVARLTGNASSRTDASGYRWRSGGHVIVWGSNTVHVGALSSSIHAVGSRMEQDCDNGFLNASYGMSKGIGFLTVDTFNTGTIYGSTNVAITVGSAVANTCFDYTYQSNGVNRLTLDITNSCAAASGIKATDLAMLPARITGFKGSVTLTDTAARSYEMPIDFTAGTNGIYNAVGCDGTGTLVAAPANGSIDITFPTAGLDPEPGKYAIARFSSGGELLKGWTVTLNGESVPVVLADGHSYRVIRDAKGIGLGVDLPGLALILR